MNLQEDIKRIRQVMNLINEEKVPATPNELIKSLPNDLKTLLFKQWGAKQNPKWHPEGNSLKHIIVVIKRAYNHYPNDPNMIMAALFHDLGKMDTYAINPKTGEPTAYGHENKSTDYVEQFKDWISTFEGTDVDEIKYLVQNHMKVKPRTWDSMRDSKKEPISSHPSFDKLKGFTDKLDGGGYEIDKEEESEGVGAYAAPAFEMKPDHEHFKHLYNESLDNDYSEGTMKIIEKMVTKMDLPFVESSEVNWSEMHGSYEIKLYYPRHVKQDIRWENEMNILSTLRPFLGLPLYSILVRSFYSKNPDEFVGGVNEAYTPWVKRRLALIRKAERASYYYMVNTFKRRMETDKEFSKNDFINMYFSIIMDEMHGELSSWGTEDFDYPKVYKEITESFGENAEELWKHLKK